MLRTTRFAVLPLLALIACQASRGERSDPAPAGGLRTQAVVLHCGDQEITVRQMSDTKIRLLFGNESFDLELVPSASGVKYQAADDASTYYWSKGDGGMLQIRGQDYPECGPAQRSDAGFRARGNEPGWQLQIDGGEMTLEADYGETRIVLSEVWREEMESGWRYVARVEEHSVEVTVANEICEDDMTGMPYPQSVVVEFDGRRLRGCGGEPSELLEGPEWIVEDIDRRGIIDSSHMTLRFDDGRLYGHAGCSGYTARYSMSGEGLRTTPAATTGKACAESLLHQEARFLSTLARVHRFSIDATGALVLHTPEGGSILARRQI